MNATTQQVKLPHAGEASQHAGPPRSEWSGISPTEVLIGQTAGLTGPHGDVARDVVLGTQALVQSVNDAGGIHGRRLRLLTLDDGHEPAQVVRNVRQLVSVDHVFGLLNLTGVSIRLSDKPLVDVWSTPCVGGFSEATGLAGRTHWDILRARPRWPADPPLHAWQLWLSYQVAMRRLGAVRMSPAGLAAYLNARFLVEAMRLCGPALSRSQLIAVVGGVAGAGACSLPAGKRGRSSPLPKALEAAETPGRLEI